ncbi:MAG: GntR family transcriptional regulator [Actinomycetota bacterium]|nr:GntR family transcriptional regulator [Actinomycetota bacterium]
MTRDSTDDGAPRSLATLMRNAILQGQFSPGQRLIEADLTTQFNATRGAVREALVQLDGEGIVERERNRGARVRPISLEEAVEITEARAVLEGLCAAKAAAGMTPEERQSLREIGARMRVAVEGGDVVTYSSVAQELHTRVREVARQATVAGLLERLRYQSVRYHFSVAGLPGRPGVGLQEHLDVIEAISGGSPEEAETAMRNHLQCVIDALRQLAEQRGTQPLLVNARTVDR